MNLTLTRVFFTIDGLYAKSLVLFPQVIKYNFLLDLTNRFQYLFRFIIILDRMLPKSFRTKK